MPPRIKALLPYFATILIFGLTFLIFLAGDRYLSLVVGFTSIGLAADIIKEKKVFPYQRKLNLQALMNNKWFGFVLFYGIWLLLYLTR